MFFTACRLSHRNDPDILVLFGVDHCKDSAVQDSERDEALLTISETIVLQGYGRTFKEGLGINEVDAMFPKILISFGLIPRHPHLDSVVTRRNYVKDVSEGRHQGQQGGARVDRTLAPLERGGAVAPSRPWRGWNQRPSSSEPRISSSPAITSDQKPDVGGRLLGR